LNSGATLEVIFFSVVRPGGMTPVKAGVFPQCGVSWLNFYTAKVTLDNLQ